MITGTKILLQPPYRGGLSLSYAEATARLAFFLTYFDRVMPLAFNPRVSMNSLLLSTELEQEYVLSGASKAIQIPRVQVSQLDRRVRAKTSSARAVSALAPFEAPGSRPAPSTIGSSADGPPPPFHGGGRKRGSATGPITYPPEPALPK